MISLSAVSHVIWLEGINDFSKNGNASAEAVQTGMKDGVARLRKRIPGVKVIGATNANHGFPEQDEKRKALNDFIRTSGVFDAVVDFDKATINPDTGQLRAEFVHNTTTGGDGDKLHPNRLGYIAMGKAFDLDIFKIPAAAKKAPAKK